MACWTRPPRSSTSAWRSISASSAISTKPEGIQVLELGARAERGLAGPAQRDVRVAAEVPLLHVGVGDVDVAQDRRSVRRYAAASAGERRSGSETISSSGTPARFRSTCVASLPISAASWIDLPASSSMWMRVRPTRLVGASVAVQAGDLDPAAGRDRVLVLGDLVALRKIRIEVVLAREDRARDARCSVSRARRGSRAPPRERSAPATRRAAPGRSGERCDSEAGRS